MNEPDEFPSQRRPDSPDLKYYNRSIEYQDKQQAQAQHEERQRDPSPYRHRKRDIAKEYGNLGMDMLDEIPGITG